MKIMKLCLLTTSIAFLTACGNDSSSSSVTPSVTTPDLTTPLTPLKPSNNIPVAVAGINQNITLGDLVTLDGSESIDKDQDLLTYVWKIKEKPEGSKAVLSDDSIVNPTFKPDLQGQYIVSLIVNDGKLDSQESIVKLDVVRGNAAPVAVIANVSEEIQVGKKVILDGSSSADSDNDPINYNWTIESKPSDSTAQLSMSASQNPSVVFDKVGTYTVGLTVSDGILSSEKTTIKVKVVRGNSAPLSNAGSPQTIKIGETVTLDGSKSIDPDSDKLSYQWSVSSVPSGSKVTLQSAIANPNVTLDKPGNYVFTLKVSDGSLSSSSNVNITVQSAPEIVLSTTGFFGDSIQKLPYSNTSSFNISSTCVGNGCGVGVSLDKFVLEAKGSNFTIINLNATSSNPQYSAFFDNLSNNKVIQKGEKLNFALKVMHTRNNKVNLNYSFTIKETGQTFSYAANGSTN